MKVKIDIEVKAEEVRTIIGLPDVTGLQDDVIQYVRDGMAKGVEGFEALTLMKQFLPDSVKTATAVQRMFSKGWNRIVGEADEDADAGRDEKSAATAKTAEKTATAKKNTPKPETDQ